MTGRVVEGIPILSAAGVGFANLGVVLVVPPNPAPAVGLVAPAVVVPIAGRVMAPIPQG